MKKRLFAIFLALSLCVSLIPAAFAADIDTPDTTYTYKEAARTVQIKGAHHWQLSDTVCATLTQVVPGAETIEYWANPEETGITHVFYAESGAVLSPAADTEVGGYRYEFTVRYNPVQLDDGTGTLVNYMDEDYFNWISNSEESETPVTLPDGEYQVIVRASEMLVDAPGMNGAAFGEVCTFYVVVGVDAVDDGAGDTPAAPETAFADVPAGAYYAAPVDWAVAEGITNGTSATTFAPTKTCTRGQIITFLWRAAGSPEPAALDAFTDVNAAMYYAKAAAWAAENGMASGSTFSPDAPCTREMAVEFMWKHAGSPDAAPASFADIASPAVDWAVAGGVTNGTSATTFSPDKTCTRAEIVTFLYRAFAE